AQVERRVGPVGVVEQVRSLRHEDAGATTLVAATAVDAGEAAKLTGVGVAEEFLVDVAVVALRRGEGPGRMGRVEVDAGHLVIGAGVAVLAGPATPIATARVQASRGASVRVVQVAVVALLVVGVAR